MLLLKEVQLCFNDSDAFWRLVVKRVGDVKCCHDTILRVSRYTWWSIFYIVQRIYTVVSTSPSSQSPNQWTKSSCSATQRLPYLWYSQVLSPSQRRKYYNSNNLRATVQFCFILMFYRIPKFPSLISWSFGVWGTSWLLNAKVSLSWCSDLLQEAVKEQHTTTNMFG